MAKDYEDPAVAVMKQAGQIPEYQQMMDYLMARRAVPQISTRYLGDKVSGLFQYNSPELPPAGRIVLNEGASVSTLVHEITHAAERQISQQYFEEKFPKGSISTNKTPLTDAFEKLGLGQTPGQKPIQEFLSNLNANWTKAASGYRATTPEARAFGVENMTAPDPTMSDYTKAPPHADATIATQFLVLLDLAKRSQAAKPQSQGR